MKRPALVSAPIVALLGLLGPAAVAAEPAAAGRGSIAKMDFGKTPDGTPVELYTLTNGGLTAKVSTYGAIVTSILAPDKAGKVVDVALGFDSLDGYLGKHPYFGAIVGRVANRIAKAKFTLDGKEYSLAVNNGPNTLHGGLKGFDKYVWKAVPLDGASVRLTLDSADGDEGYPGNLSVSVTYTVTDKAELKIDYEAMTDKATPINLSNHSYFNLAGPAAGTILDHEVMIAASRFTPVDSTLIPTGELAPVKGTPFDFTRPMAVGARIAQTGGDPVGYDHNYVLDGGESATPKLAARVRDPKSGRVMDVLTTEPGLQFYTGNFLDGSVVGRGGVAYQKNQGFCMETQHFPDSIHHANFPKAVLKPGETYRQTTIYKFTAE